MSLQLIQKVYGGEVRRTNLETEPCVAIKAEGIGGGLHCDYTIAGQPDSRTAGQPDSRTAGQPDVNKPPYRVPSMVEIAKVKWNGLVAADLFSGCGGSCLGFRMAGFRVAWANEFVAHAQECYKANFPDTILDCRDVRTIQPEEILEAIGLKKGELDLLSGSPPCQSFSTCGKREKGWGKEKTYENGAHQKNETLFDEYVRILRGLMPKVFVAENVSGLAKGTCKGFFLEILAALKASGYVVECRLLDAQWLGVPQQRQRLIFIGVRNDIAKKFKIGPAFPKPLPYRYSVADACPWIGKFSSNVNFEQRMKNAANAASAAICANGASKNQSGFVENYKVEGANGFNRVRHECGGYAKKDCLGTVSPSVTATQYRITVENQSERRKFTIAELKRICAFSDDFALVGSYAAQWARLGNAVPPVMMASVAHVLRDEVFAKLK